MTTEAQIRLLAESLAIELKRQWESLKDKEARGLFLRELALTLEPGTPLQAPEAADFEAEGREALVSRLENSQRLRDVARTAPQELRTWCNSPAPRNPKRALGLFLLPPNR